MTTRSPVVGFERLLSALGQDLIDASDEEIMTVVHEVGLRPAMRGSIAFYGVTFAVRLKGVRGQSAIRVNKSPTTIATTRGRRRPKGDAPS